MDYFNLLIIDDEIEILENLKYDLKNLEDHLNESESTDIKVYIETATSSSEALERAKKTHFHCLITDVNLPKLNGVELIQRIRSNGHYCPVIFLTGYGSQEILNQAMNLKGTLDFINKPYKKDELIFLLSDALGEAQNSLESGKLFQNKEAS